MRVKPAQLVDGCVLLKEIRGKSPHPIIKSKTVLTATHRLVLEKFLIPEVEVANKLNDGKPFQPEPVKEEVKEEGKEEASGEMNAPENLSRLPFKLHFLSVINLLSDHYISWEAGKEIQYEVIKKNIFPLLERIEKNKDDIIYQLPNTKDMKTYIFYHSVAVSVISTLLAKQLGYSDYECMEVGVAALLADAGMAKIDNAIIFKKGPYSEAEFEQVKNHATYSYRMVEEIPSVTKRIKLAILQHHERMDGSGYPLGLSGEKVHHYAKIIGIADSYHAMISQRPHRTKLSPFQAMEELQRARHIEFDGDVLDLFLENFRQISVGSAVMLSNEEVGEVVFVNPDSPTRPIVRLKDTEEMIALEQRTDLHIVTIVQR